MLPCVPQSPSVTNGLLVPGLHNLITRIPPVTPDRVEVCGGVRAELADRLRHGLFRHPRRGLFAWDRRASPHYAATFGQLKFAILTIAAMLGFAYLILAIIQE